MDRKITRVLIVDDSILFREVLSKCISEDENIEVVGKAGDPYEARDMILQLRPDVVTLDVEMPKMNGIQFLKKLIPQYPIPVVVVSALPLNAFEALDAGAVDFIKKPLIKSPEELKSFCMELRTKVVIASTAKIIAHTEGKPKIIQQRPISEIASRRDLNKIIALGASTGGTDALQAVVEKFPKDVHPILIVQHMPAVFTKMYADRMNRVCQVEVKEAEDGDRLRSGLAIIAAGEFHMRLAKDSQGYYIKCARGEKVSGHCPSVDVMFQSVAEVAKENAIGAILTGMGGDGAKGLLEMRKAGAYTIGQNKETCVVYGMPMVAFNIGAVCEQAPLDKVSEIIYQKLNS